MLDFEEFTFALHQPINHRAMGVAERMVGLAKQCARRLLLASQLPDIYWSYAMRFAAENAQAQGFGISMESTCIWRRSGYVEITRQEVDQVCK